MLVHLSMQKTNTLDIHIDHKLTNILPDMRCKDHGSWALKCGVKCK